MRLTDCHKNKWHQQVTCTSRLSLSRTTLRHADSHRLPCKQRQPLTWFTNALPKPIPDTSDSCARNKALTMLESNPPWKDRLVSCCRRARCRKPDNDSFCGYCTSSSCSPVSCTKELHCLLSSTPTRRLTRLVRRERPSFAGTRVSLICLLVIGRSPVSSSRRSPLQHASTRSRSAFRSNGDTWRSTNDVRCGRRLGPGNTRLQGSPGTGPPDLLRLQFCK